MAAGTKRKFVEDDDEELGSGEEDEMMLGSGKKTGLDKGKGKEMVLTPGAVKKVGGGGSGSGRRRRRERKSYIDGVEIGEEGVERGWKKYLVVSWLAF